MRNIRLSLSPMAFAVSQAPEPDPLISLANKGMGREPMMVPEGHWFKEEPFHVDIRREKAKGKKIEIIVFDRPSLGPMNTKIKLDLEKRRIEAFNRNGGKREIFRGHPLDLIKYPREKLKHLAYFSPVEALRLYWVSLYENLISQHKRVPRVIVITGRPSKEKRREQIPPSVWDEDVDVDWMRDSIKSKSNTWFQVKVSLRNVKRIPAAKIKLEKVNKMTLFLYRFMRVNRDTPQSFSNCYDLCNTEFGTEFGKLTSGQFADAHANALRKLRKKYPNSRWGEAGAPTSRSLKIWSSLVRRGKATSRSRK